MYPTFQDVEAGPVLRFERRLAHRVDVVFRALTEPEQLARWFPGTIAGDLRNRDELTFTVATGVSFAGDVVELDPPRRLVFHWGDDLLRFELEPLEDGQACQLRFEVVLDAREKAARDGAGWQVCLERLEATLQQGAGNAPDLGVSAEWSAIYEELERRGVPSGAEIPHLEA
ncbi:MAG TPA: SRPBCC family protein [Solirubrobacteraceae bacterium]|jgi:uncharacterized protein YndB with AHSA1/START domain|nr:SRPBCC family protein [Solirubrobacteraceae bacterium]